MRRRDVRLEAETYAKTVATFFSDKPFQGLLEAAFLSGYRLCEKHHDIDDELMEQEMRKQPGLFEWVDNGRSANT